MAQNWNAKSEAIFCQALMVKAEFGTHQQSPDHLPEDGVGAVGFEVVGGRPRLRGGGSEFRNLAV